MLKEFTSLASIAITTTLNIKKEAYYTLKFLKLSYGVITSLLLEIYINISNIK